MGMGGQDIKKCCIPVTGRYVCARVLGNLKNQMGAETALLKLLPLLLHSN